MGASFTEARGKMNDSVSALLITLIMAIILHQLGMISTSHLINPSHSLKKSPLILKMKYREKPFHLHAGVN